MGDIATLQEVSKVSITHYPLGNKANAGSHPPGVTQRFRVMLRGVVIVALTVLAEVKQHGHGMGLRAATAGRANCLSTSIAEAVAWRSCGNEAKQQRRPGQWRPKRCRKSVHEAAASPADATGRPRLLTVAL